MEQDLSKIEPQVYKSMISVPYDWWAGDTATRFFRTIANECKFVGTKCEKCNKVFVPPRKTCPQCLTPGLGWVNLGDEGELVTFTVARKKLAAIPYEVPAIYGLIRIDGASTAMLHRIAEIDPAQVKIGMRLKAKFADERKGHITDIEYFKPV